MIDEKKVELMTRMACYESKEGKEDLKISAFYRKDYVSLHTLYSILWVTFGYACLVGLAALAGFESLMDSASIGLLILLTVVVIAGYLVVVIGYAAVTHMLYNKKHQQARMRVKKYNHDLVRLLKLYEKENESL